MNLYLISQTQQQDYDTYDCAVVCAEAEDEARSIHPASQFREVDCRKWRDYGWCKSPDMVTVKLLGVADKDIDRGVLCSSFNAS